MLTYYSWSNTSEQLLIVANVSHTGAQQQSFNFDTAPLQPLMKYVELKAPRSDLRIISSQTGCYVCL